MACMHRAAKSNLTAHMSDKPQVAPNRPPGSHGSDVILKLYVCAAQVNKERESVRAPVALAVVKLLKHLPPAAARAALPAALQKVANLLKLRLQRIRCAAL